MSGVLLLLRSSNTPLNTNTQENFLRSTSWNRHHSEGRVRGTRNQQIEAYSFPDCFFFFAVYSRDALVSIGDQESNIDTLLLSPLRWTTSSEQHWMLTNTTTQRTLNYTHFFLFPSNAPSSREPSRYSALFHSLSSRDAPSDDSHDSSLHRLITEFARSPPKFTQKKRFQIFGYSRELPEVPCFRELRPQTCNPDFHARPGPAPTPVPFRW